jgi:predicted transcriptional regulator of viral defense system
MKRNRNAGQTPVFLAMQKHPGVVYNAKSLADEMGLDDLEDVASVGRAMTSLCAKGHIERVAVGRYLFRKVPVEKPAQTPIQVHIEHNPIGDLYEVIGIRKSTGRIIVKSDSDDTLYELEEL